MKRIVTVALVLAATLIASGSAFAQDHAAKATVPFNFNVGSAWMPAGTYTLGSASYDGRLIQMTDRNQKVNQFALGTIDSNNPQNAAVLIFHHYGDRYFLSEIRYPNSEIKVRFVPSKTEKRAANDILEGGLRVNSDVEIALTPVSTQSAGQ